MRQSAYTVADQQAGRHLRARGMRYAILCLPLFLAYVALSLIPGAEASPYRSPDSSALSRRDTVMLPGPENFIVGGIHGEPPTTRYYDFVVTQLNGAPDGFERSMLVVNGMYPGPTIEANEHDQIIVKVTNLIAQSVTFHWHGMTVYDGPDQLFNSEDMIYSDGVVGALIVHPSFIPSSIPPYDGDFIVLVSDLYHQLSSTMLRPWLTGVGNLTGLALESPQSGMINGIGQFAGTQMTNFYDFNLQPNKTYRFRFINVDSDVPVTVSLDFHPMTVIEIDKTFTEPYDVSNFTIFTAQRCSVLITTNQTEEPGGNYWIRSELTDPLPTPGYSTDLRAIIRYSNSVDTPTTSSNPGVPNSNLSALNVTDLVPAIPRTLPDATLTYTLDFMIGLTATGGVTASFNNTPWQPLEGTATLLQVVDAVLNGSSYAPDGPSVQQGNQFIITIDSQEVVDILLVNTGMGDHPLHLHGYTASILGTGTGNYTDDAVLNTNNPIYRDISLVPNAGWTKIRFLNDNPGVWAFHCHIALHMAAGLLMQINSLPSQAALFDIPQVLRDQCTM
ncbi:uncharacterized protein PHACADRAFT_186926 [Phanerochaete carnosa HHB-10118-sp]|uniref:laccase n=1 Tax=Phanerochaete carnosa (strain HHB-10118-sp) TaxID=650164 RepID=K5W1C3_PHACS|nr:uncharacterized protein PHACADRAFT_186926 [Phanerochaete carnosa HHB-10118-sp]EKM52895.1 hypothetical protein PHACADRAFT_186926 [Phanerochaete carnosa HHB-10118-sp]